MKHYFDFSHITIADLIPLLAHNPSGADLLIFANKVVLGGVFVLPASEVQGVLDETSKELKAWVKSITTDNSALEDMLRGVEGL